jgi:Family of unknown function (DUF6288)
MNRIYCLVMGLAVWVSAGFCAEGGGYALLHATGHQFNLGPTGIWGTGVEVSGNVNYFTVQRVEAGSPAHGLIQEQDVIIGANGKSFPKGDDALIYLGYAMIDSEAKDGKLRLQISRGGSPLEVTVKLDKIPDYSPAWPFNCARTDRFLSDACDYLAREQLPGGEVSADDGRIGPTQAGLLWLAMGEPKYLENARRAAYWFMEDWLQANEKSGNGFYFGSWTCGYGTLLMAEYYQMTGDRNMLPGLELAAKVMAKGQMPSGSWSHYFYDGYNAGYGEVNNAGMICYMALLLCKESGVKVDEEALRRAEKFYDRFAPTLTSMYGDHYWVFDGYGTQNGKVGGLAVAHFLNGRKLESEGYALKSARSVNSIQSGHTGPFFNFLWTPVAASLAPAKEYRQAMDQIGWYYELSRTWRGGVFCQPGTTGNKNKKYSEYGPNMTTAGFGLSLAVTRRHLRILGAPKSVFVQVLPAELDAACKLHQANQWDKAITAVDAFLKKSGLDAETIRLAKELRDKARYVKAGVAEGLAKLDKLSEGSRLNVRAYEVSQMIKPMRRLLGEEHPRITAIEERLPGEHLKIWSQGKSYYEAFDSLKKIRMELWFVYSGMVGKAFPDIAMPFEEPEWTSIAKAGDDAGAWKAALVPDLAGAPKGWSGTSFDDSSWTGPAMAQGKDASNSQKRSKPAKGCQLVRSIFDLKSLAVKQLRLHVAGKPGLLSGAEVYLNGELVLKTESGINKGGIDLLKEAPELLRVGHNVLAYATQTEGGVPKVALEAHLDSSGTPFAWADVPGRDGEICKLTAVRGRPRAYYQEEKDTRTAEELMKAFNAEPSFMPEIYCALGRYNKLAPAAAEKSKHISKLLASPVWGARWTGLVIMEQAMTATGDKDASKMCDAFKDEAIKLLNDPHALVRCQAALVVGEFGDSAKAAIPRLLVMATDFEGQTWWTRLKAWEALNAMSLDEVAAQAAIRAGLKDPAASGRRVVLERTFLAKDKTLKTQAAKTFTKELVDQVFTAPHGMALQGKRATMGEVVAATLSKDEVRPCLPRFFEALSNPSGDTLSGSMNVLAAFSEETQDKLKVLTEDKNENVRYNALETLQMMVLKGKAAPELKPWVVTRLQEATASKDSKRVAWAKKLLVPFGGGSKKSTDGADEASDGHATNNGSEEDK